MPIKKDYLLSEKQTLGKIEEKAAQTREINRLATKRATIISIVISIPISIGISYYFTSCA